MILFAGDSGYVNTNTGKSGFYLVSEQMNGLWQSRNEPLHKVEYGATADKPLVLLRDFIDDVGKGDSNSLSSGSVGGFPIEPMREAVV